MNAELDALRIERGKGRFLAADQTFKDKTARVKVMRMAQSLNRIDIFLEAGSKKTFAGVIDWPGWIRSGPDEQSAIQSLFEYGQRYQRVVGAAQPAFRAPKEASEFLVVERLEGNATTDFGAPDASPSQDKGPVDQVELLRFQALLKACWAAFDRAVAATGSHELRKGPRGGGRDLEKIIRHMLGAEAAYLGRLGWKFKEGETKELDQELSRTREAILIALASSVRGELPAQGPRGGLHWTPRYFVRRVAWHVLDHTWEVEDRSI